MHITIFYKIFTPGRTQFSLPYYSMAIKQFGSTEIGFGRSLIFGWGKVIEDCFLMSECQTKAGNQECFEKLSLSLLSLFSLLSLLSLFHSFYLDMLNNFCFHVYAQKSLFIAENCNAFFGTSSAAAAPSPVTFEFIELVPS